MSSESTSSEKKKPARRPRKTRKRKNISVLHASDLHLGASFQALAGQCEDWVLRRCRQALEEAWQRIVDRALSQKVDLVTLVGDSLDRGASLAARSELVEGLGRLAEAGITTVILPGEHDHAEDPLWEHLDLPEGTVVLGGRDGVMMAPVKGQDGELAAVVHAWVGEKDAGMSELPKRSGAAAHRGLTQIGLAHVREELIEEGTRLDPSKLDLWLLGGEHRFQEIRRPRLVACYAGNPQGLSFRETGARGCAEIGSDDGSISVELVPVSPVLWVSLEVDLSQVRDVEGARQQILEALGATRGPQVELVLVKLITAGSHFSPEELDFARLTRAVSRKYGREIYLASIENRDLVAPEVRQALTQQGGFAGAVLRQIELAAEPGVLRRQLLNVLRAVWEDRDLMEEAGLTHSPEEWLERLLPQSARRAADAIGYE